MPNKEQPIEHDLATFAGRQAEREARESTQGQAPRRQLAMRVDQSEDFIVDGTKVRRVQA